MLFALAFLVFPLNANQQDIEVETYNKLIEQGHYRQAVKVAIKAIEKGNKSSELSYSLANIYNNGKYAIKRNEQKAAFYYEKAIQLGNYQAAREYGLALTNGYDFPEDCKNGTSYLYLAHENDVIEASALLGSNYLHGHCVTQNFKLAKEFLAEPLEQENAIALNAMGVAYFFGEGLDANLQKAFNYFKRAANKGNCNGEYHLAAMYDNGIFVDVDLKKAFELFEKSHLAGCSQSTIGLANMYYLGRHVPIDNKKAFALYEQVSESGDLESISIMATMLIDGIGVEEDKKRGFELLHKAAKRGDEESRLHLGNYHFDGDYVEQSYSKAAEYYQTSLVNPFSRFALGYLYEFGLGVEQNLKRAEELYVEAYRQGNVVSTKALALWYINGKHYARDHGEALNLLQHGSATNDDENVALHAMLLACSSNDEIQNIDLAHELITEQKKLRDNIHIYEVDLAEVVVLGALGDFASAKIIIEDIEDFYLSEEYTQFHIRHWYARERFLSIKQDINSFRSCSW